MTAKKVARIFLKIFRTRFSQGFGIICISGGYQDVRTGFYQVFTLHTVGISRFQREKPTRNLPKKNPPKINPKNTGDGKKFASVFFSVFSGMFSPLIPGNPDGMKGKHLVEACANVLVTSGYTDYAKNL